MKEVTTDLWAILLPEEWYAEQEEETIVISDEDEVSVIEMTTLHADNESAAKHLLQDFSDNKRSVQIAGLNAFYHEMKEEGMYWREWYCALDEAVLIISHGCDEEHQGYDDATVDEILSTLAVKQSS